MADDLEEYKEIRKAKFEQERGGSKSGGILEGIFGPKGMTIGTGGQNESQSQSQADYAQRIQNMQNSANYGGGAYGGGGYDMRNVKDSNTGFKEKADDEVEKHRQIYKKGSHIELNDLTDPKGTPTARLTNEGGAEYDYQSGNDKDNWFKNFLEALYEKFRDELTPATRVSAIMSCICCFFIFLLCVTSL